MRGNHRRDTRPELALRRLLHGSGHRFRVDLLIEACGVKVRPDIVFTRRRVAVFIDGCFWHSCPKHGNQPNSNVGYWLPKLQRNQERDSRVTAALEAAGWKVLRIWEHEPVEEAASRVESALSNWIDARNRRRSRSGGVVNATFGRSTKP